MASSRERAGAVITGINVTPLVDVTLVLLVIFVVTAKLVTNDRAIGLDLPRAASGQSQQTILSIELFAGGARKADGVAVPDDARLAALAREALRRNAELRAVIQADGSVPHRTVVGTLDVLRRAGIARVGFGVRPP
jgi:biopolymer transport protein ExbD